MVEISLLDELREIRRRLSEEQGNDPVRYAAMLRKVAQEVPGIYVDQPLRPEHSAAPKPRKGKTVVAPARKR